MYVVRCMILSSSGKCQFVLYISPNLCFWQELQNGASYHCPDCRKAHSANISSEDQQTLDMIKLADKYVSSISVIYSWATTKKIIQASILSLQGRAKSVGAEAVIYLAERSLLVSWWMSLIFLGMCRKENATPANANLRHSTAVQAPTRTSRHVPRLPRVTISLSNRVKFLSILFHVRTWYKVVVHINGTNISPEHFWDSECLLHSGANVYRTTQSLQPK